jgi:hypothetical protein
VMGPHGRDGQKRTCGHQRKLAGHPNHLRSARLTPTILQGWEMDL